MTGAVCTFQRLWTCRWRHYCYFQNFWARDFGMSNGRDRLETRDMQFVQVEVGDAGLVSIEWCLGLWSKTSDIVWNQAISNIFAGIAGPDIQQAGALSYSASDVYKLLCFVCLTARNKVLCSIKFLLQKSTHCSRDSRSDVKHLKISEQISDSQTYILRQDAEMNGICLGFAASFVKFCLEPVFHWQIFRGMLQLPAPEAFFVLEDMQ